MSPDGLTARAAAAATTAWQQPVDPDLLPALVAGAARVLQQPLDADLRAWAGELVGDDGFPLVGTGQRAETGAALLWSGARLARGGVGADVPALLAGLAAGRAVGSRTDDLARGLAAARAVAAVLEQAAGGAAPGARATTAALGAAACAALLTGADDLEPVLDAAASLMVLTPGGDVPGAAQAAALWAGHAASAGHLAALLPATGVTALPGGLAVTLACAAGPAPTAELPADVAGLVGALA